MKPKEIFETKAYYNNWLNQLTESEKGLILEMLKEAQQESTPMDAEVMQKATVIWVIYDEYGELETEFIYSEEEKNKMPYQCEKYLRYNKNKTAKRLSCFSA